MARQVQVSAERLRVRPAPAALRRRSRLARLALLAALVLLGLGWWLPGSRAAWWVAAVGCAVLAVWGMLPRVLLRRRHPWALVLDDGGITTASGLPPGLAERRLPWAECTDLVVATQRTTEGRQVVFIGFLPRGHDESQLPVHHVVVLPDRRGLRLIDQVIAWVRRQHPDVRVTVSDRAREIGVHLLGR